MSATSMFTILRLAPSERQFVFSYSFNIWSPPCIECRATFTIWKQNVNFTHWNFSTSWVFGIVYFQLNFLKCSSYKPVCYSKTINVGAKCNDRITYSTSILRNKITYVTCNAALGGPSINCLFRAFVDSSITVESEPDDDDDPWDACVGNHSEMNPLKKTLHCCHLWTHNIVLYRLVYKNDSRNTFVTNYIKLFICTEAYTCVCVPLPSSANALKDTSNDLKSSSNMSESTSTPAESLRVKEVKAGKLNFDST